MRSTLLKITVQAKTNDDCVEIYKKEEKKNKGKTYMYYVHVRPIGPWAGTMKLRDIRSWPGLMRGWVYPRDSTVVTDKQPYLNIHNYIKTRRRVRGGGGGGGGRVRENFD